MMIDAKFTQDQKKAYDAIMSGADVFLTGGAGTGKSTVLEQVILDLKRQYKTVLVCAPTAAAALRIGGITIHSLFGFPVGPCVTKTGKPIRRASKVIRQADVILIDEISLCRLDLMDSIIESVKKARSESSHPVQLVIAGDFCQLPPVITTAERELLETQYQRSIGGGFAFQANGWKQMNFKTIYLKEIVRQEDKEFIRNLNLLRMADPACIPYFNQNSSGERFANEINLYARNIDVEGDNRSYLAQIPGTLYSFNVQCTGAINPNEYETALPNPLYIKKGARVVITQNVFPGKNVIDLGQKMGLYRRRKKELLCYNGTMAEILDIDPGENGVIIVQTDDGAILSVERRVYDCFEYIIKKDGTVVKETVGTVAQFPIRLGYSTTIHRSQGQTYQLANIDPTCWMSGQLYVALSRIKTIKGIHLLKRLLSSYLILDPAVKEFYEQLDNKPVNLPTETIESQLDEKVSGGEDLEDDHNYSSCDKNDSTSKKGRPARYPNGSKTIRLPCELVQAMETALSIVCPKTGLNIDEMEKLNTVLNNFNKREL